MRSYYRGAMAMPHEFDHAWGDEAGYDFDFTTIC